MRKYEKGYDQPILLGVCDSLGKLYNVTPWIFRAGFLVLMLFKGIGIPLYIGAVIGLVLTRHYGD